MKQVEDDQEADQKGLNVSHEDEDKMTVYDGKRDVRTDWDDSCDSAKLLDSS